MDSLVLRITPWYSKNVAELGNSYLVRLVILYAVVLLNQDLNLIMLLAHIIDLTMLHVAHNLFHWFPCCAYCGFYYSVSEAIVMHFYS